MKKPKNLGFEPVHPKNVLLASVVHGISCLFFHHSFFCKYLYHPRASSLSVFGMSVERRKKLHVPHNPMHHTSSVWQSIQYSLRAKCEYSQNRQNQVASSSIFVYSTFSYISGSSEHTIVVQTTATVKTAEKKANATNGKK
jgi:hypothetical protein